SDLIDRFAAAKSAVDRLSPRIDQAVVAEFIEEGHFARHVRRMRTLYCERAEALVHSADSYLAGALTVVMPQAGMHTIGWLTNGESDVDFSRRAAEAGVRTWSLSACYRRVVERPSGLILGFAAYPEPSIVEAVRTLARMLERS